MVVVRCMGVILRRQHRWTHSRVFLVIHFNGPKVSTIRTDPNFARAGEGEGLALLEVEPYVWMTSLLPMCAY